MHSTRQPSQYVAQSLTHGSEVSSSRTARVDNNDVIGRVVGPRRVAVARARDGRAERGYDAGATRSRRSPSGVPSMRRAAYTDSLLSKVT